MDQILSFEDALTTVLRAAATLRPQQPPERLTLLDTLHRTLATAVLAPRDQPPFDRSTRDGYALQTTHPGPHQIIGTLRAGEPCTGPPLRPGQALEIMTGAPVPPGADAVLMLEHASRSANTLTPTRMIAPGANIVPRAAEAHAGATLLTPGTLITPAEIAVAASTGLTHLYVHPKPRVAILATGDELVELGDSAEPHQIYNSNTYALAALVAQEGGHPIRLAIARDTPADLRARLTEAAATADLILLSGGVSAGRYDLVEPILAELGATFLFTGAQIQPGKPIVFGRLPTGQHFFGLPGNPISTQVCFHLFAAPLLRALTGRTHITHPFTQATLTSTTLINPAPITRFLPAELTSTHAAVTVRLTPWQGSGDTPANARANCYLVIPPNTTPTPGDTVQVLLR